MDEKILNAAKEKFSELTEKAKDVVKDNAKVQEVLSKAEEKIKGMNLKDNLKDLPVLFSMVKSHIKGEYKEAPITTIVALVAALMYFVSANDIISDKVPILGLVDDAAIMFICLNATKGDVEKYKVWLQANNGQVENV